MDSSEVHIFSDSQSAIGILQLGWQPTQHKHTVAEMRQMIKQLEQRDIKVDISWTMQILKATRRQTDWPKRYLVRQQL